VCVSRQRDACLRDLAAFTPVGSSRIVVTKLFLSVCECVETEVAEVAARAAPLSPPGGRAMDLGVDWRCRGVSACMMSPEMARRDADADVNCHPIRSEKLILSSNQERVVCMCVYVCLFRVCA